MKAPPSPSPSPLRPTTLALLVIGVLVFLEVQYQFVLLESPSSLLLLDTTSSRNGLDQLRPKNGGQQIHKMQSDVLSEDPWQIWNVKPHGISDGQQTWTTATTVTTTNREKRPLNFVHIAKNGGSSIVQAAIDAKLNWGDCLFQQHWPGRSCPLPPAQPWPAEDPTGWGRVWWHLPPAQLPLEELSKSNVTAPTNITIPTMPYTNPYDNYDLFAVMRNPYDRAVSEFYYHCGRFPNLCKGLDGRRATRVLNRNIQQACKVQLNVRQRSEEYIFHEGHWIPQHNFFVWKEKQRKIEHLLHLETLDQEFPSLMRAYNLHDQVILPHKQIKARSKSSSNHHSMSVLNLTISTVKLIEVVYEKDFILGGYEMVSPRWGQYLQRREERALEG